MFSMRLLSLATLVSLAYGHSQIINAQGIAGSPASVGFLGTHHPHLHSLTKKD